MPQCFNLSATEVAYLVETDQYRLVSGPHDTQAICGSVCSGTSSASSSVSPSSSLSVSPSSSLSISPSSSLSGTPASSGSSQPPIQTGCCVNTIPATLIMTIVQGCDGATPVQTMTYNPSGVGGAGWFTTPEVVGANTLYWVYRCVGTPGPTDFQLEKNCDGSAFVSAEAAAASCSPFDSGDVTMPISGDCCSFAIDAVVRITQ